MRRRGDEESLGTTLHRSRIMMQNFVGELHVLGADDEEI